MTRRRWFLLGVIAVVAAWFLLPSMCSGPKTPEEKVRAAIGAVAMAVEEGDLPGALEPVSRDYLDGDGADFAAVRAILWRELQRRHPITVHLGPMEVEMESEGRAAEVQFVALLMDGVNVAALDIRADNADAWHFTVQVELEEDDEWRIVSHQRRGVLPQDVFE